MSHLEQERLAADARLESVLARRSAINKQNHYLFKKALRATGAFELTHDADTLFGVALGLMSATERDRMQQLGARFDGGRVEQMLLVEIPGPVDDKLDAHLIEIKRLKRHTYAKSRSIWLYRGRGYREDVEALVGSAGGHVSISQIEDAPAAPAQADVIQSPSQVERRDACGLDDSRDNGSGRAEGAEEDQNAPRISPPAGTSHQAAEDAGSSKELRNDENAIVHDGDVEAVITTVVSDGSAVDADTAVSKERSRHPPGHTAGRDPDSRRSASLDRKDVRVKLSPVPLSTAVIPDWLEGLKPKGRGHTTIDQPAEEVER